MTGKLAGIPYCPAAALSAAAANGGGAEPASSSCPAEQPGRHRRRSPPAPARRRCRSVARSSSQAPTTGLLSPWQLSPPPRPGPSILGTVVVRVALFVEPETAQIRAVSDPIPDVFGGTQLSVRSVDLEIDRKSFTLNPTSCGPLSSARRPQRRRRRPDQSGDVQRLPGQHPVPDQRLRGARLQAEAVHPAVRRAQGDQARPAPEIPRRPRRPRGRRQHQPRRGDPAALPVPRPEPHRHRLHQRPAGRAATARRRRSTATPARRRRCSTTNWRARSTSSPPTTNCRTCWPTCTARSTSACAA